MRIVSYFVWCCLVFWGIVIIWKFLGDSVAEQIQTLGLILQLLGVISVTFELIRLEKIKNYAKALDKAYEQGVDLLLYQPLISTDESPKQYTLKVAIKLTIFSITNLVVYFAIQYFEIKNLAFILLLFGLPLFYLYVWAWSYLINIAFNLTRHKTPHSFKQLFELFDYGFSMIAVMFLLLIFIPVRDFTALLTRFSVVDRIALITLPLFFFGTALQLSAALLP